jgi:multimeric flavodoxin WrbA
MKVLLVNGSPNANGCVFTALSEIAGVLEAQGVAAELFQIGSGPVQGCTDCGACWELDRCVFEDDPCNTLSAKMKQADGIIIGSPVYYAGPNGALCALLDRVFFSSGSELAGKPAAAIVSCRRGGASAAFDRLNKYFTISQMPVVSSQYWNAVHGNTPDEVRQDAEGMQIMRTLGKNMAWLIQSIAAGNVPRPARDEWKPTNFIR